MNNDFKNYEYELYEEKPYYAVKKHIYGISCPYTIEEIENILLGNDNATVEELMGVGND